MQKEGYKKLAKYYDAIYESKNYDAESLFVRQLLEKHNAKTVLDVGCGTGSHIARLEQEGFECTGVDLNQGMLDVARQKVKGALHQADMSDFDLKSTFDAVICMFAGFNHLTEYEFAAKALSCFYNHLNPGGFLLIDLHNPQKNGNKVDKIGNIQRTMEWVYNKDSGI